jgi:hypothetical protein
MNIVLKKGDKVIIHTHKYAEKYPDRVYTCTTDEEYCEDFKENEVWLKELSNFRDNQYGKPFLTRFLTKVDENYISTWQPN